MCRLPPKKQETSTVCTRDVRDPAPVASLCKQSWSPSTAPASPEAAGTVFQAPAFHSGAVRVPEYTK